MSQISIIPGISSPAMTPRVAPSGGKGDGSLFLDSLKEAMSDVNDTQKAMNTSIVDLQAGKGALHETMIQVEKADLSFKMLMQVRNKVLEAYKEIMRMSV
ncbi:MAG TPA: flagellar hook-basal body complex protein FliE [Candidatus Deferrimicrobiaceae bacterium]|jgi:flagellar hook-basal body complex protein FliE